MSDQQPTYLDESGNPVGPTYLDENGKSGWDLTNVSDTYIGKIVFYFKRRYESVPNYPG